MADDIPLTQIKDWPRPGVPYAPRGRTPDVMAQPTVVIVVDDNAGLLKSVARL
jgi:hypothetical protein